MACRVLVDDRELLANPDLRSDAEPVTLKLDVSGAKQLTLEIDFGQGQDVGDRVLWAGARVFRPTPSVTAVAPAAPDNGADPQGDR